MISCQKSNLVFVLLLVALSAKAQVDTLYFDVPPDSTGFGSLQGKLVAHQIGPDGGIVVSDDGIVQLRFPVNAVSENTTITVQAA